MDNYGIFVVQLLEDPIEKLEKNDLRFIEIEAIIESIEIESIEIENVYFEKLFLLIWGDQVQDTVDFYRKGDHVLIEGNLLLNFEFEKNAAIIVIDMFLLF
uniref:Ycf41 n=1 Tax=Vacuolaria virescens TaxID=44451 RepID=UPI002113F640|nr:Ycf41 [Vacuolaria virescens]UTE94676.1 Ycf41 [Vacuolaria virescens]